MNTDSYFEIGSSHDVCQDFALTGNINKQISFAIVSDGCSESHKMSREVDFGARILSYATREALKEIIGEKENLDDINMATFSLALRNNIIETFSSVGKQLKLSELFSDATLVIVISDSKKALTFTYGDGGVIVCKKNGDIIYREITFTSSAPYYLSYLYLDERNKGYKIAFGASPIIITNYLINGVNFESQQSNQVIPSIYDGIYDVLSSSFDDFTSISVVSDGIKSYEKLGNTIFSPIMAPKFVAFKNKTPGFQKRRFNFLNKENREQNITHFDDVSIATIVI